MSWVLIDDAMYDNPKVRAVGPLGFALHVSAIIWSNRNLTDGQIPRSVARTLWDWTGCKYDPHAEAVEGITDRPLARSGSDEVGGIYLARWLVMAELWHTDGHNCERCEQPTSANGFVIHDYLTYQRSAAEIQSDLDKKRQVRSLAGRKGAQVRWHKDGKADGKADGKHDGSEIAELWQNDDPNPNPNTTSNEVVAASDEAADGDSPSRRTRTGRRTQAPDEFLITPELRAWAAKQGITADLVAETEQFLDYHRAKGSLQKDWVACWRTWMRNTKTFASRQLKVVQGHPQSVWDDAVPEEWRYT